MLHQVNSGNVDFPPHSGNSAFGSESTNSTNQPSNLVIDENYNFKLIDFSTCYFYDKNKRPPDLIKSHRQLRLLDSDVSPTL